MFPTAIIICICLVLAFIIARIRVKRSVVKNIKETSTVLVSCVEEEHTCNHPKIKNGQEEIPAESESTNKCLSAAYKDKYIDAVTRERIKIRLHDQYIANTKIYKAGDFFNVDVEYLFGFIYDYEHLDGIAKLHNEEYVKQKLEENKTFFDTVLKYPLDEQQRRAIVLEECSCLVISSAGSGKTSTIVGKVEYLTKIKKVAPEDILLISYTNKAAAELTERIGAKGLRGYTFHKLALDMIGQATKAKPTICDNSDRIFVNIFKELMKSEDFKKGVLTYFIDYQEYEDEQEKQETEKREQLKEEKQRAIKSDFPDMDGNHVEVKSQQEKTICLTLTSLGIRWRYEQSYEHRVGDENHSQYKPDFSLYYNTKDGKTHRVYLENYGVDEHSQVPQWFATEKGISYEEANKKYNDGITWKRETHKKFGTTLLELTSADFHYFDIKEKLKDMFRREDIPFCELSDGELLDLVLPPNSSKEKTFIRLVITFITLMKTNCRDIGGILSDARKVDDERAEFIIENIIAPVYRKYEETLAMNGEKDFTDIIIEATHQCEAQRSKRYEYIIVDEFQDISIDRYKFLQALRKGNPPAKIFCVGDDWQSIYRFSGSDIALINEFADYFGPTEIAKIETTYRFGNPLVDLSSMFIQRNPIQIKKTVRPFKAEQETKLLFYEYDRYSHTGIIEQLVRNIPTDKSIFLLGRYSFDDYHISSVFPSVKHGNKFCYIIDGREVEFMTVHKSKGLEADYVILLQCNKDVFGFPSTISDDPVLHFVLSKSDTFPFGEERRLFYVAITRAKTATLVLFEKNCPSAFVAEFLHPERLSPDYSPHPNANKRWSRRADKFLLDLHHEGKSVAYISQKMGRSKTSIIMRLQKLGEIKK